MKKLILLITTFFVFVCINAQADSYDEQIKRYDELFNAINKKRLGLKDADIDESKSPFVTKQIDNSNTYDSNVSYEDSSSGGELRLLAILEQKVKIGSNWYEIGDTVGSYKLTNIKNNSVDLSDDSETIELKLIQGNKNVEITIR